MRPNIPSYLDPQPVTTPWTPPTDIHATDVMHALLDGYQGAGPASEQGLIDAALVDMAAKLLKLEPDVVLYFAQLLKAR